MSSQTWWDVARAGGIVAWALASLTVIGGLQLSTRLVRKPAPSWVLDVHRFLGGLTVAFVVVHMVGLAADQFIGFGPAELLVPFASSYKPAAVALGVVGMYLLVAIEITSLAMQKLPRRTWHAVHLTQLRPVRGRDGARHHRRIRPAQRGCSNGPAFSSRHWSS